MLANSLRKSARRHNGRPQAGVFSVEFAIVLTLFLTLVFGAIELARAMYLFNTLQEATRTAVWR
jgi:Flp pilus assembly protein TadG